MLNLAKLSSYPWQDKRGSILMVSLWILIILTLLTIGVGWRTSCELRFVRIQRDRLKAFYLSKAGIKKAILEINSDETPNCDSLKDNWADNEEVFKEIKLADDFATVSYTVKDEKGEEKVVYGVMDEERKININIATKSILSLLPEITEELADNICAWRGDINVPESAKDYRDLGYVCKGKPFVNVEELLLVKVITSEIFNRVKDLITVWGQAVNINTASKEVIGILIKASLRELEAGNEPERDPGDLVDRIMSFRQEERIFEDVNIENKLEPLTSGQRNVINEFKKYICVDSNFFRIISIGKIKVRLTSQINCVLDFNTKRFLYWNES